MSMYLVARSMQYVNTWLYYIIKGVQKPLEFVKALLISLRKLYSWLFANIDRSGIQSYRYLASHWSNYSII